MGCCSLKVYGAGLEAVARYEGRKNNKTVMGLGIIV
jgi:hypothetical protein